MNKSLGLDVGSGIAPIFDRYVVMEDKEGYPYVDETMDKLHEMLNAYGVEHSFTYPFDEIRDKYPNGVIAVLHKDEDDMLFSLVYALFLKAYRNVKDEKLAKSLVKMAGSHVEDSELKELANRYFAEDQEARKKLNLTTKESAA